MYHQIKNNCENNTDPLYDRWGPHENMENKYLLFIIAQVIYKDAITVV